MRSRTTTAKIDGKLDAPEADELFRTITSWGDPNASRRCVIDLTDLEFMLPAGLTAVVQCAAHLKDRGWSPTVRFPARDDVGAYLARMGFRRALRGVARSDWWAAIKPPLPHVDGARRTNDRPRHRGC